MIVGWSTLRRPCVMIQSESSSGWYATQTTQFFRGVVARGDAAARLSLMGFGMRARFAVDQATITGRSRLVPDSLQPLFAGDHCTFSPGRRSVFFLDGSVFLPGPRDLSNSHDRPAIAVA